MPSGRRKVIETWMLVAPNHVTMHILGTMASPKLHLLSNTYFIYFLILKVLNDSDTCGPQLLLGRREQCFSQNCLRLAKG